MSVMETPFSTNVNPNKGSVINYGGGGEGTTEWKITDPYIFAGHPPSRQGYPPPPPHFFFKGAVSRICNQRKVRRR